VVFREISLPVRTSGKLAAVTESRLSFKTGGIVEDIHVDEGQDVRAGQLLAQLDLDEIEAQVAQARSAYGNAKRDYERAQRLYADSVVTLEQVQDAETGLEIARSAFEIASFNLEHSVIRAPNDGKILRRFVEVHELIGPGSPVFVFGSSGGGWVVRVGVTDRDMLRIEIGDSASITFDAYPGIAFPAAVDEIAQAADPLSGAYEVELLVDPGERKLVSGFVAGVDIFPKEAYPYHLIPVEAIVEADGQQAYVFVPVEAGGVQKIGVETGPLFGDLVAVSGGLAGHATVVTEGAAYLSEDSVIKVVGSGEAGQRTR
jgi:RND family efflux transporter MFP subunit